MTEKQTRINSVNDSIVYKINHILQAKDRFKLLVLMLFSVVTALIQTVNIAAFLPFINLLMDQNSIHTNRYMKWFYTFGKFTSDTQFVIAVGAGVITLILITNGVSIVTNWMKNRFLLFCTHNMSNRLLKIYLHKPYEFILMKNSSELGKNILSDVIELTHNFLNGIVELVINSIMMFSIIALLLIVNVKATIIIFVFFGLVYGSITLISRNSLRKSGVRVMNANRDKYRFANEALNSFKILKSYGIEEFFLDRFARASKKFAKYRLYSKTISEIPKYFMDALVFCGLTAAIEISIIQGRDISAILPVVSVFTVAGYRMMPELAKIFTSISVVTHNRPILDKIYNEICIENNSEQELKNEQLNAKTAEIEPLSFSSSINLSNIVFKYQQSGNIINDISLEIKNGTVVGFAGTTGAGKTTLIDIILGLLKPNSGGLYVDQTLITDKNISQWRSIIGYVPQEIYLIDDTIRANIAFGIPDKDIDDQRIRQAAEIAAISDFIENELPNEYLTIVGERGVRLSGGQRQRLGLARAIYRNPLVLILDEATSALDGATEESVIRGIHQSSNVKTIIIIAHRLNTLKSCDQIYVLEHGEITDKGNFIELFANNPEFRRRAQVNTIE